MEGCRVTFCIKEKTSVSSVVVFKKGAFEQYLKSSVSGQDILSTGRK